VTLRTKNLVTQILEDGCEEEWKIFYLYVEWLLTAHLEYWMCGFCCLNVSDSAVMAQQLHDAVPSDEEWHCGHCLCTQSSGTSAALHWGRRGITDDYCLVGCSTLQCGTVVPLQRSLLPSSPAGMEAESFSETLVLFYQTKRCPI
jgi:hypothetical protein